MASSTKSRLGSRGRPEETRAAILQAAIQEFAHKGLAGARTDAIARVAHVNKALLYYYFKDKETLYGAALDHAFGQLSAHMLGVLDLDLPPDKKVRKYVGEYFDFVAGHPLNRDLVQREMTRAGHSSPHLQRIAKRYFQPLFIRLSEVIRAGIGSGKFRQVDPVQFVPSMVALVIFYFTSAPLMKTVTGVDPLLPERIAARRAAVLDFITAALFQDPAGEMQGESK
ncbi:MAG TPA: TetR/AcrR family transcriptional regulator [Terriglobales bacterium]